MATVLLALGLVLAVEGLIFAVLPGRLEEIVRIVAGLPPEVRRVVGLMSLATGVALVWAAKHLGA